MGFVTVRFNSKVDLWLAVVMAVTVAIVVLSLAAVISSLGPAGLAVAAATLLLATVPVVWMFAATYYEIRDATLLIVCGPMRWKIPLRDIESVTDSHNMLSSPALSLDRLKITYAGGRYVLISPKDKQGFREALKRAQAADPG